MNQCAKQSTTLGGKLDRQYIYRYLKIDGHVGSKLFNQSHYVMNKYIMISSTQIVYLINVPFLLSYKLNISLSL